MGTKSTTKKAKGQLKARPDTDDPRENPLLYVENNPAGSRHLAL